MVLGRGGVMVTAQRTEPVSVALPPGWTFIPFNTDSFAGGGRQLFYWWRGWPRPSGNDSTKRGPAKRRPIRAYPGYAKAVACYVQQRVCMGGSTLPGTLREALAVIREWREVAVQLTRRVAGALADCAALWYGGEEGARPCGCGDERLCPLCGGAAADRLASDAKAFLFEEFLEAVKPRLEGSLASYGAAYEIPAHKAISIALEELLKTDPERWRKEANRLASDSWAVIQVGHPEGQVGGYQSVQLYGESNPGQPHFHTHNVLAPVVVVGQVWQPAWDWDTDKPGRVLGQVTFERLARWLDDASLAAMRLDWGRRQCLAALRLGLDPAKDLGAVKRGRRWELVGDVHRSYFGWRTTNQEGEPLPDNEVERLKAKALGRAKYYLGYQARWPGQDFVSGLKADGLSYTWTGPVGSSTEGRPEFTGHYTSRAQPIYERQLSVEEVTRAVWRLDAVPAKWPRLRWRGFLSPGNVKAVMETLECEQVKAEKDVAATRSTGELLRPVGGTEAGLVFVGEKSGLEFELPWEKLGLTPVDATGKPLVRRREKAWVSRDRDGPGEQSAGAPQERVVSPFTWGWSSWRHPKI